MTTADGPRRADGWTAAVRQRLGLGRLLPLGGPADGAWIAERAAVAVLRRAVTGPGPVLGELRISVADPDGAPEAEVEPPPSALRPGPLRIEAAMSAVSGQPLPAAAEALRSALLTAAGRRLGLVVAAVDVRVTELLDAAPEPPAADPAEVREAEAEGAAGAAAAGVEGVVTLTRVLGHAVHARPDHVRVELATAPDHRALDVARAVRAAVAAAVEGDPTVAVLVTAVMERE
ncbi:hypothetical protein OIC43_33165 [Streptomyces sp. NBC_00825]|uniref:hypothetical protein n=1 Tax=unclassified Streptomyces TaxID=2593676 RepID=UPI002254C723|nr:MULTISPECIES: hypothetical protein [unclassified Streptomyces]WTB53566.1 hypothetical protein OG832_10520 [Streptomyces sp. NBC_00826]WTH93544.1 hypothetical protein OIC43_33165 [Streptomyces sp. NBC_00825]WTI02278.1 hypothetical protein OHA23_33145 [Streptomyces sp. NBC_00822]MCX4867903.1 hypothetical protein [Streptomyces sp. NBC_00906]MCX4899141.1 hypothetical protein [Streptomyces sp. NBC_00892]